jgi:hypothetical protein
VGIDKDICGFCGQRRAASAEGIQTLARLAIDIKKNTVTISPLRKNKKRHFWDGLPVFLETAESSMSQNAVRLTAAQVIILAAEDIMSTGAVEFTEWDLTVASWTRDRTRFGLRGYDQKHPDHKRVMMEIMGQKPQNPLALGFMEKVRPNIYRLTPLGRAVANRLRSSGSPSPASDEQSEMYRLASDLTSHAALVTWRSDPDQPRWWADASAFLVKGGDVRKDPHKCLNALRRRARSAMDWCMVHDVEFLVPASRAAGEPIHVKALTEIIDFLQVLEYRFPEHLSSQKPAKTSK